MGTQRSATQAKTAQPRTARNQLPPPPYDCTGISLWGFLARADHDRLHKLCDETFRQTCNDAIAYEPVGAHVLLTFGAIDTIASAHPAFADDGSIRESHAAVWVIVRRVKGSGPRFAAFSPYMWVDNPISLVAGREYFGYQKSWGQYAPGQIAAARKAARSISLELSVLGGPPHKQHTMQPLLSVAPANTVSTKRRALTELHHFLEHLATTSEDLLGIEHALKYLSERADGRIPQIFVKCIPNPDGLTSSLIEVCTSDIEVKSMTGRVMFEDHKLTVTNLHSERFFEDTGISDQTLPRGFFVRAMSMTLHTGTVVWHAP